MKFMLYFKGEKPDAGGFEQYNRRWQSWMEELEKRGVLESGAPFSDAEKNLKKIGGFNFKPSGKGLAGYLVINVSTEEEAVEIAKQAPHIALGEAARSNSRGNIRILGFQVC